MASSPYCECSFISLASCGLDFTKLGRKLRPWLAAFERGSRFL
jgi:hypothetical protein